MEKGKKQTNREQRKKTLSGRQEIMVFRVFFSVNAHA